MKFEYTEVFNFKGAFRGMRNAHNSWDKLDSYRGYSKFVLGDKDKGLAQRLIKPGTDHSKFMRQIMICVDITAPLYWWKEFDTYKVGTVANSTSTMHKLSDIPITIDCFEIDNDFPTDDITNEKILSVINDCEMLRKKYLQTKNKAYWELLIKLLPESWLQKRTVTLNYQVVRNIRKARKNHKLDEWSIDFMNWIDTLPYSEELIKFDDIKE